MVCDLLVHSGSLGTSMPQAPGLPQVLRRSPGCSLCRLSWARPAEEMLGTAATEGAWAQICHHQP